MRIEIDFEGGKNAAGIFVHMKLPEAMGNSVAAFAHAVLSGQAQPGVWYPEEKEALSVRLLGVGFINLYGLKHVAPWLYISTYSARNSCESKQLLF